jgi:DNA-binding NarL/FixJ family response regulator
VLLLEIPRLLRDILEHSIQLRSDCELLKDTRGGLEMLRAQTIPPDIIVLGLTAAQDATLMPALFARWPMAQIVTVTHAGDDGAVYELRPRRRVLGQMSPTEIVEALREAVLSSREPSHE